jgi:hypothetical protein
MLLAAQGQSCRLCDMKASLDKKIYKIMRIEHRVKVDAQVSRSRKRAVVA